MGSVYKILAKVLANHLKEVLAKVRLRIALWVGDKFLTRFLLRMSVWIVEGRVGFLESFVI